MNSIEHNSSHDNLALLWVLFFLLMFHSCSSIGDLETSTKSLESRIRRLEIKTNGGGSWEQ